jgi:hypothetical protein
MLVHSLLFAAVFPSIWIVDASNGPGTHFTSLPAAVAAAASGDTLIVRAGTYAPFNVSWKALTIRGAGSSSTFVTTATSTQQTVIAAMPAGMTFYLGGIAFGQAPSSISTSYDPAIHVTGPGRVVISDAALTGFGGPVGGAGLAIDGGAVVHAARCIFTGGGAANTLGGSGAFVGSGCALAADASMFTGGIGGAWAAGGMGLQVLGGTATLSRCSVTGGSDQSIGAAAGIGVRVQLSGFVRIAGAGTDVIQAGAGVSPYSVVADPSASVIVNGSVVIFHPTYGPVTTGAPALPYISITGTSAGNGELQAAWPVTVTIEGMPFAPYVCAVDAVPWFSTAYSTWLIGELLIPVPVVPTLQGALDATGILQFSVTPALEAPSLTNLPVYLQVGVVDTSAGKIRMSNGLVQVFQI